MSRNSNIQAANRYLANTLHEIRTPIQTIISATELIQGTNLDHEQSEYIRQIQFSAEGLLSLANNILDIAKIQSDEFKFEAIPFDIRYMTEHIVDSLSIKAFNKGVEVITDIDLNVPAMVSGDSMRVRQIMLNIVSNAVKFTESGWIKVHLSYKKSKGIIFSVADTGIGISEDKKKKLFTDYFQADISTYRIYGGTGLGLSICKTLVAKMNGKIRVFDNPDSKKGTVFEVTLPLSVALENSVQIKFQKNPDDYRILIADDNLLAAQSMKKQFLGLGFTNVEICVNSGDALDVLKKAAEEKRPFKIAFIDMIMPDVGGWHLAFAVNGIAGLKDSVSLYLLVPECQMGAEAKMTSLGWFKGYLYKPVKRENLINILDEALSENENIETLYPPEKSGKIQSPRNPKNLTGQFLPGADDTALAADLKILIAEDHPLNRSLMESFMKKFGAAVFLAEDGVEAVEQIKKNPDIDMIFMDIYMPKKSGIEATVDLRNSGYGGIIVACTANNDSNDFEEYMKIGVNDILVKPFKSEMIKNIIEKWKTVMQTAAIKQITTLPGGVSNEKNSVYKSKSSYTFNILRRKKHS